MMVSLTSAHFWKNEFHQSWKGQLNVMPLAMPVVVTDYPTVTEFEADWGALKNHDASLEKSSSSASSADPLVVATAQAELDEA